MFTYLHIYILRILFFPHRPLCLLLAPRSFTVQGGMVVAGRVCGVFPKEAQAESHRSIAHSESRVRLPKNNPCWLLTHSDNRRKEKERNFSVQRVFSWQFWQVTAASSYAHSILTLSQTMDSSCSYDQSFLLHMCYSLCSTSLWASKLRHSLKALKQIGHNSQYINQIRTQSQCRVQRRNEALAYFSSLTVFSEKFIITINDTW